MTDIFKSADWAREALEREAEAPVLTGESSLTEFSAAEYDEFFGWLASKPIVPPYKFDMSAARLLTPAAPRLRCARRTMFSFCSQRQGGPGRKSEEIDVSAAMSNRLG